MIDLIKATFHHLIAETKLDTFRYLYHQFNIDNRLAGIVGARGVGKTTLMLQYIKENLYDQGEVFYFSADNIYFNSTSLFEFTANLYHTEGIKIFFIDEIHRYGNWCQELKNIYDSFPNTKVVFSGSSSVDLIKGIYDLSRRTKLFRLAGLSFREYLNFKTGADFSPISFDELMINYKKYDSELSQIPKIKGHLQAYMQMGYYPFFFEDQASYYEKILQVVDKAVYVDIANCYDLKTGNLGNFKRILNFLATSPPGNVNVNNLAKNLTIDNKTASHYLQILGETGLIRLIATEGTGNQLLRKPEKIFLHNTTLLYTLAANLSANLEIGTMREIFFIQSLIDSGLNVFHGKDGDFQVQNMEFEIGGKNKQWKQLKNTQLPAFLVKDDILTSSLNTIPLYFFGFLY
jgi:uncharacterized protein